MNEAMESGRPLNPNAPPYYPTRFHKFRDVERPPPPPAPPTKTYVRHSLTPLPSRPRNRSGWFPRQREPPLDCGKKFRMVIPLRREDFATSVMIRNIPNNYTHLLVEFLEKHCKHENENEDNTIQSAFDFVYLPVDFKRGLNAGYAFVNFTSHEAAWKFHTCVKGKRWELFQSKKIADVTRAKIQGKEALVKNFEKMKLCSPSSDYLPVWFDPPRDGCMPSSSTSMKMHLIGS